MTGGAAGNAAPPVFSGIDDEKNMHDLPGSICPVVPSGSRGKS
jgi:hypothetical protein